MITTLLSLSLLAAAAPAVAPDQAPAAAHVRIGDLDLHSAAGRAELDRRLVRAVHAVCPETTGDRTLRQAQQTHSCRTATLATVAKQRHGALAAAGVAAIETASNGR